MYIGNKLYFFTVVGHKEIKLNSFEITGPKVKLGPDTVDELKDCCFKTSEEDSEIYNDDGYAEYHLDLMGVFFIKDAENRGF